MQDGKWKWAFPRLPLSSNNTTAKRVREQHALVLRPPCVHWRVADYGVSLSEPGILPKVVSPNFDKKLIELGM